MNAEIRLHSNFAGLQTIEALRLHAAANGGRLPKTLEEVTIIPIPLNPATEKPFPYEFRDGVARPIDYAKALDCRQLNCLVGIAPRDADPIELNEVLVGNLRFAADALAKERIKLLVEPINTLDIPGFFLNRTEQAVQLIADVRSSNLFIQYDIYHMQVMEGDIARTVQKHLPRIAHIQLADNPGRNEPGTGEINYPFLFRHLDAIGYRGWVGCEYKPRTTTVEGLGWHAALTADT
jgi:hydroxypyruvate isomerase